MIAATAWWRLRSDGPTSLACGAFPSLRLPTRDEGIATGTPGVA